MVENGDYKLYFLCHAFAEFLNFFVVPGGDAQFFEPFVDGGAGIVTAHAFEAGKEYGLFANAHFFVESAFFG